MLEKALSLFSDAQPPIFPLRVTQEAGINREIAEPDGRTVYSFRSRVEPDSREVMGKLAPMLR